MNSITTSSNSIIFSDKVQKRRETFRKASKKYLDKDNNRELHKARCLHNYYLKKEFKRLSTIMM